MRKAAIVLALIPFIVVLAFSIWMGLESGFASLAIFAVLLYCMPVLALLSVTSAILAYWKRETTQKLDRAAKVLSLISSVLFVSAGLMMVITMGMRS